VKTVLKWYAVPRYMFHYVTIKGTTNINGDMIKWTTFEQKSIKVKYFVPRYSSFVCD